MAEPRVAFLGLGEMGRRMARRLMDSGLEVIVWNRSPGPSQGFPQAASTPAEAAARADVAILMVTDQAAVAEVTRDLPPDLIVVDMSTSGPAAAWMLGERFAQACDAPVGGSLTEAESGTLAIYAGGPDPVIDRVAPVLERLGTVYRVGPLGCGQAVKVIGNLLMLCNVAALGEGLEMARRAGLDPRRTLEALAAGPGASRAITAKGAQIVAGEFGPPARFRLRHALKDAELARGLPGSDGFAELVTARLRAGAEHGRGEQDYSALAAIR